MPSTLEMPSSHAHAALPAMRPALVIAWCTHEPDRIGEVLRPPRGRTTRANLFGRGDALSERRMALVRQRPGHDEICPPLTDPYLSSGQLVITRDGQGFHVQNKGRCALSINLRSCDEGRVTPGDLLILRKRMILRCVLRPASLPPLQSWSAPLHPFGEADPFGMIGESAEAWALREKLSWISSFQEHVLVVGESGSGKELAAQAIHALSSRKGGPLISRNAATVPEGLIDAELFGNIKNYPNPGTPSREGLIGAADGGSLLLDEIGELPEALQAHLLRVLDSGQYQRLGDAQTRTSDFRLIAVTNRGIDSLKADIGSRLQLLIAVPPLRDRPEDVPLLIRALLRKRLADNPVAMARFVDESGHIRVGFGLLSTLLRHPLPLNVRELNQLLWTAVLDSTNDRIGISEEITIPNQFTDASEVSPEQIKEALAANHFSREKTWRALGLKNRYVLKNLMKKYREQGYDFSPPE